MKNARVGDKVTAYAGSCVGIIIQSTTWNGEIIKVNQKSIRVRLNDSTSKFGSRVTSRRENIGTEVTYRFVKTLSSGKAFYRSEGGIYGSIEIG